MTSNRNVNNAITFGQLNEIVEIVGDIIIPVEFRGKHYKISVNRLLSSVDKDFLGLDNVDNTSDLNKPLSYAVVEALKQKAESVHTHNIADLDGFEELITSLAPSEHNHSVADVHGLEEILNSVGRDLTGLFETISFISEDISNKSDKDHTHDLSSIPGLVETLQSLQDQISNTQGNDHNHSIDQINGLVMILSNKSDINHGHSIEDLGGVREYIEQTVEEKTTDFVPTVISTKSEW